MTAITFDFGQTLAELDLDMLVRRLAEQGARLDAARAARETDAAWAAYGDAKRAGLVAHDAWCTFMRTLLERSGVEGRPVGALAEWLWEQQPIQNLWRKPIAGMFELVEELFELGVPLGVVSNSEGKLSELCVELGIRSRFRAFADSGVLGVEKPDKRIFEWTAAELGVSTSNIVHVGDAWEADVVGALNAGARAIWFAPVDARPLPEGVRAARNAPEVRSALGDFGALP
ncbi:MAG: HAD family hydrolase [Myxococcales bacterium]|nr:HAD family hydrolase [Myxococcales bacterium]